MKITYQLKNSDFLEYQLYTSSKSKLHKKKRLRSRIIVPIFYFLFGFYLSNKNDNLLFFAVFSLVSIIWFLLYPLYSRWKYKNHFKKHIKENYKNRINKSVEILFDDEIIKTKDYSSESKINKTELKELIETKNHYFLKLQTDLSIIIPKDSFVNQEEFIKRVKDYGVDYIDELSWVWK
ncbi:YcxB family protein [Polaribacter aquimarinus]|uniref:YcxB-like C-terminal domain-containing protein n=1 Tax=Polaribacter aquimarinus TaxID=2100726 RepID=A0A2U2J9U0_9FLAO|nr:YcxB family protein [Polaribacter aquimarinus]PWG05107.1 hypothetical protein DIS07_07615 [Polaribacter aquimarinus]